MPAPPPADVRLVWVDVFALRPLGGNPLAVLLGAEDWPGARMQATAFELGLSETVVVLPPDVPGVDARLRIFTPRVELPMAGHPVVGTAWVLRREGLMGDRGSVLTGAGPLPVEATDDGARMGQAAPAAGPEVDAAEVGAACGVVPRPWPPARVWSTGVPQLMLPVPDRAAVAAARPDADRLVELGARDGWLGVSVYAVTATGGAGARAWVRHFAPGVGVPEDPVTGSAAGALGACLAAAGMGAGDALELVVHQGDAVGRPGQVDVRVRSEAGSPVAVSVGGRVTPVLEGRIHSA